jgi:hypothetical protein
MSANAREALRHLTAALEAHLEAVESRRSATDAAVDDAFDAVAETFERYEDVLDTEYGEALPLILDDEIADALDEAEDDDETDEDADDDLDDADLDEDDEELDPHAVEDEDELDDDLEEFDLR